LTGETDLADRLFREDLVLCRELAAPRLPHEAFIALAADAAARGETHHAARLAGAAVAHRDDAPLDEAHARVKTDLLAPARARRGSSAWDASTATAPL